MRRWIFLPIIVMLGILQVTVLDYFKLFGVKPDLLFLVTLTAGFLFYFELKWVLSLGIFAGILKDILSPNPFGINTLLFPLWNFVTIKLSKKVSIENNFLRSIYIFIIVALNDIVTRLIYVCLGNFIPIGVFLRITFLGSLYTALISPLVFEAIKPIVSEK